MGFQVLSRTTICAKLTVEPCPTRAMNPVSLSIMKRCNILLGTSLAVCILANPADAIEVGQSAPSFTMVDLITEEPFSLSDYNGQVIVLNFWGYW